MKVIKPHIQIYHKIDLSRKFVESTVAHLNRDHTDTSINFITQANKRYIPEARNISSCVPLESVSVVLYVTNHLLAF